MNYSYQIWSKKASSILKNIILLQHVTDLEFLRVHQRWVLKKIKPKQATKNPAVASIIYSRVVKILWWLEAKERTAALPDMPVMTIKVMVEAMPREMVIPSKIPSQVKSRDMANSITITTPGQGMIPTAIAVINGLLRNQYKVN